MPTKKTKFIVRAAIIAAAYAVLTLALAPLAFGSLQLRLSEALTVLAYFSPAAVCGLTVGCAVANLWSPFGITDVVFGAAGDRRRRRHYIFHAQKRSVEVFGALALGARQRGRNRRGDRGVRQRRRGFLAVLRRERTGRRAASVTRVLCGGPALLLYLDGSGLGKRLL